MWTLGFDSTASTVSAALLHNGRPVCTYSADSATSHSTTLLPAIEQLLSAAHVKIGDLSLIACSAGPGSFTGVRIGVATAKGLAAPHSISCVGVSSLEAMAYSLSRIPCVICPVLGARRGNVYTALFASDGYGKIIRLTDDDLVAIADLGQLIASAASEYSDAILYTVGDVADEAYEALSGLETLRLMRAPELLAAPTGYGVAACGEKILADAGDDTSNLTSERLLPIYLRKSQAEREREEKAKR